MWGFLDCSRYFMKFGVPKIVLDNASMAVASNEKVGLLAAPGAGKSTIIRLLAGVDTPNSGGTGTADTASGGKSSQGTSTADAASGGASSAGSDNGSAGQSHKP